MINFFIKQILKHNLVNQKQFENIWICFKKQIYELFFVRIVELKQEGWWIVVKRFSQVLKVEWKLWRVNQWEIIWAKKKTVFKIDFKKSTDCFCESTSCFYQQFIKTKLKQFKECKDREIYTRCLYWFTLN